MNCNIEKDIQEWIYEISRKNPKLMNFSICPFAKQSKFKIIECSIYDIKPLDEEFDVVIFVVENDIEPIFIEQKCKELDQKYPDYSFFDDCKDKPSFINGVQTNNQKYNLVLYQNKKFLSKMREILSKTNYYDLWDKSYLKTILGSDYNIIKK